MNVAPRKRLGQHFLVDENILGVIGRLAELEGDVLRQVAEPARERAVDLDGVHAGDPVGEVAREHAEAGADLEHDVVGGELREAADHAEHVLVDEEVLAELLLRAHGHSVTLS